MKYIPDWFPGAGFKGKAKVWRKYVMAMIDNPFDYVKKSMVSVNPWCLPTRLLTSFSRLTEQPNHPSHRDSLKIFMRMRTMIPKGQNGK